MSGPVSVLHRIGEKKQQREVEGRHLPNFTLAAKPNANQNDEINNPGPQHDLQCNKRARREKHSVQLAVTGTGALFGVLKYPVALFLSTVQTTNSNKR